MSKLSFSISALLMIAVCFSSCTIQKRVHTSGYHVAWKNQNRRSAKKEIKSNELASQPEKHQVTEPNHTLTEIKKTESPPTEQPNISASNGEDLAVSARSESYKLVSFKIARTLINQIEINSKLKTEIKNQKSEAFNRASGGDEINKLGLISFLSTLLTVFGVLLSFSSFPSLVVIAIPPAWICGAFSLRQFKENPGRFKHRWMPITGVFIGFIGLGIVACFSLLYGVFTGEPIFFVGFAILLAAMIFIGRMISSDPRR